MKRLLFTLILIGLSGLWAFAQKKISGIVYSKESVEALHGASVRLLNGTSMQTGKNGEFELNSFLASDTLFITYVGYLQGKIPITNDTKSPLKIYLEIDGSSLEEVEVTMNTGYYSVPKERATGSFTHVDNKLLNREVGGNILQRLEGITSGMQFINANGTSAKDIRVRGLATIQSDETPLIVLDDFPYEGDIENINPNDVESITILKDAAAASIWGARAGNGVIVITSKQGKFGQKAQVSLNSNMTIGDKPDLYYSQNRLPSETVMQIEKEKYKRGGFYLFDKKQIPFPEYIELLIKYEDMKVSEDEFLEQEALLKNTDVFEEALKYLYQPSVYQQYAFNVRGGGESYQYYFSIGYDKNRSEVIGNENDRLNINLQNTFKPVKGMELTAGIRYSQLDGKNNGLVLNDLRSTGVFGVSPYTRLQDESGNALPVSRYYRLSYLEETEKVGLLDWYYRPLDEVGLADNKSKNNELQFNGGLRYVFWKNVSINSIYQYGRATGQSTSLYFKHSYYVRDIVNRFTQSEGSKVIAHNGILNGSPVSEAISHSGRIQLNYQQSFGKTQSVSALGGAEIREQVQLTSPGYTIFNYDTDLLTGTAYFDYTKNYDVLPSGKGRIPQPSSGRKKIVDRYLSYFGNVSYSYLDRYIFSGSVRWDGSNLFGVKTNQKGTPLWSIGGSWDISNEPSYEINSISYLRMRLTYGSSGNVNKRVSVFPTIIYNSDFMSGLNKAIVRSAGNPSLRWEQVHTLNIGLDMASKNRRISGGLDYYIKKATDLIGEDYLAPSTGIITNGTAEATNLINYADLQTKGWDLQIASQNLTGRIRWQSNFLLNYVKNKITHFNTGENDQLSDWFKFSTPPVIGKSRDVVYAQIWNGLSPENGLPIIYIDGKQSTDYPNYFKEMSLGNLLDVGLKIPSLYGSLRNDFQWQNISLSFLVTWKSGYVFRRTSMNPGREYEEYGADSYHLDYFNRWKQPGDEKITNVPTGIGENTQAGTYAYQYTTALIEKGDHIRIQDISASYTLSGSRLNLIPVKSIRFYAYARNLGILWKANKKGIDPDYSNSIYPAVKTFALGLQVDF